MTRRSIATVSLSGLLADKLATIAAAGFDGVEIFDNDLVASPLSPEDVAKRCADLGLRVELFQPVRDVEGVRPADFPAVVRRVARKLDVAAALGAPVVLLCSNVQADAIDDPDLSAAQLAVLGDLAAERGLVLAFEALAWGRHVDRVGQAWDVVRRADHPAVTLAVDTFHLLSRGDDARASAFRNLESWSLKDIRYFQDSLRSTSTRGDPAAFKAVNETLYSAVNVSAVVQRRTSTFLLKSLLPLVLLILVVYVTLFFPASLLSQRLSVAISALLAGAVLLNAIKIGRAHV